MNFFLNESSCLQFVFAVSPSKAPQSVHYRALPGKSCLTLHWLKLNLSVFAPLQFVLLVLVQAFGKIESCQCILFICGIAAVVLVLRFKISRVYHLQKFLTIHLTISKFNNIKSLSSAKMFTTARFVGRATILWINCMANPASCKRKSFITFSSTYRKKGWGCPRCFNHGISVAYL